MFLRALRVLRGEIAVFLKNQTHHEEHEEHEGKGKSLTAFVVLCVAVYPIVGTSLREEMFFKYLLFPLH
jgi:nitrate reductase NapE component